MAWVARGKCKALGKKKSSTPAVVPGAAPALAKAGSADSLSKSLPRISKYRSLTPKCEGRMKGDVDGDDASQEDQSPGIAKRPLLIILFKT